VQAKLPAFDKLADWVELVQQIATNFEHADQREKFNKDYNNRGSSKPNARDPDAMEVDAIRMGKNGQEGVC
jgi:hypothetical protein